MTEIPSHMQAAQVVEYNKPYKIHSVPVPSPSSLSPHDLLVRVAVASLCHTDSMVSAGIMGTPLPCTASHEGAGTVIAVGSSVNNFHTGDRVMCGLPFHPCGHCEDCLGPENYTQYCTGVTHVGVTRDGCFAEYVRVDSRTTAKLPDRVSFETAAPLACAGCTVFRAVLQAGLKQGEWIGIVGSGGGLGHLGIQFARAFGLNIAAIDARDEGLQLSKHYMESKPGEPSAGIVVDAREEDAVTQVQNATGGQGVHATINLSDAATAAKTACEITRMHGVVVQVAQPPTVDIPFAQLVFRDIRLSGSLICSPAEARQMLEVVAEHGITVRTNVHDGLEKIPELVELAHGGKMMGKGVVIIDRLQLKEETKLVQRQEV